MPIVKLPIHGKMYTNVNERTIQGDFMADMQDVYTNELGNIVRRPGLLELIDLSDHSGISINWQADEVETSLLWSQQTAQGDTSCKEISFNKGTPIRTLSVQVEKSDGINTSYFASKI